MNEILQWVLILVLISIPPVFVALIDYYGKKKKRAAEAEEIKLKNKITKDITYDQLKSESKHKDIKNKIEVFQSLVKLEEEIKNKEKLTDSDQKKLESLEMIKKEFKETFEEKAEENLKLGVESEKNLAVKKEDGESIKKTKSIKTNRKKKEQRK